MIEIENKKVPHSFRNKYLRNSGSVSFSTTTPTPINGGGANIDVLKIDDGRTVSDENVFSSLRALLEIKSRIISLHDTDTIPSDDNTFSSLRAISEILSRIIKDGDTKTELSDENVLSSLRIKKELNAISQKLIDAIESLKELYLSKVNSDTAKGHIILDSGATSDLLQSKEFSNGALGSGYLIKRDPKTGKSYIEVDELYVRLKAIFDSIEIKESQHVSGQQILSCASIKCTKVDNIKELALRDINDIELYDINDVQLLSSERRYRCYFTADDGEKAVFSQFVVGDFAQCRQFNIKEGAYEGVSNRYYWRYVVAVGDDYIDLSVDDCAPNSDIPQAGDTIIQLGNRTDPSRQNAILLSAYGDNAPITQMLQGIDSYSLEGKAVKDEGFDSVSQLFYSNNYGRSYIGTRDGSSYIKYTPEDGVEVSGAILLQSQEGKVWAVSNKGLNIVGDESGAHLELSPDTCDLRVYNEENKVCTIVEGNEYNNIDDIYNQDVPILTALEPSVMQTHMANIDTNISPVTESVSKYIDFSPISESYFDVVGETTIQYKYYYAYTLLFNGRATGKASIKVEVIRYENGDFNTPIESYVLLNREHSEETGADTFVSSIKLNIVLPVAGRYKLKCSLVSSINLKNEGDTRLVSRIRLTHFEVKAIPSGYVSRIFANGMTMGDKRGNNITLINRDYDAWGKYLQMDIENDSAGIKVTNTKLLGKSRGFMGSNAVPYGIIPRILACGYINITANYNPSLYNVHTADGATLSVSKISIGKYKVTFPEEWHQYQLGANGYVTLTGYDYIPNSSGKPAIATLLNLDVEGFTVAISNGASLADGECFFELKLF